MPFRLKRKNRVLTPSLGGAPNLIQEGNRFLGSNPRPPWLFGHAAGDEPRSGAPDFGLGDPGIRPLLAHRFVDQLINGQLAQFAAFDVPSSPRANLPCRFPDERMIHEDLLRSKAFSYPRPKRLDGYSVEICCDEGSQWPTIHLFMGKRPRTRWNEGEVTSLPGKESARCHGVRGKTSWMKLGWDPVRDELTPRETCGIATMGGHELPQILKFLS